VTLPAGARLGPYEIRASLGAGGMGEVYRARDTRLKRDVAIKILSAAVADDSDRLRRFQQEAPRLRSGYACGRRCPHDPHAEGLAGHAGSRCSGSPMSARTSMSAGQGPAWLRIPAVVALPIVAFVLGANAACAGDLESLKLRLWTS
jgi:hypothetical protein